MLKLTVVVSAVVLAGTASADGWKSLRVDASSEAAYQQSLAVFNEKLSPPRQSVFADALMDIWLQGTAQAGANQTQYTVSNYYQQIHGLSYEEIVTFTDPTGETAKQRYREADRAHVANTPPPLWPMPGHGTQGPRTPGNAHETLHSGVEMKTRNGTTRCGGSPTSTCSR